MDRRVLDIQERGGLTLEADESLALVTVTKPYPVKPDTQCLSHIEEAIEEIERYQKEIKAYKPQEGEDVAKIKKRAIDLVHESLVKDPDENLDNLLRRLPELPAEMTAEYRKYQENANAWHKEFGFPTICVPGTENIQRAEKALKDFRDQCNVTRRAANNVLGESFEKIRQAAMTIRTNAEKLAAQQKCVDEEHRVGMRVYQKTKKEVYGLLTKASAENPILMMITKPTEKVEEPCNIQIPNKHLVPVFKRLQIEEVQGSMDTNVLCRCDAVSFDVNGKRITRSKRVITTQKYDMESSDSIPVVKNEPMPIIKKKSEAEETESQDAFCTMFTYDGNAQYMHGSDEEVEEITNPDGTVTLKITMRKSKKSDAVITTRTANKVTASAQALVVDLTETDAKYPVLQPCKRGPPSPPHSESEHAEADIKSRARISSPDPIDDGGSSLFDALTKRAWGAVQIAKNCAESLGFF